MNKLHACMENPSSEVSGTDFRDSEGVLSPLSLHVLSLKHLFHWGNQ